MKTKCPKNTSDQIPFTLHAKPPQREVWNTNVCAKLFCVDSGWWFSPFPCGPAHKTRPGTKCNHDRESPVKPYLQISDYMLETWISAFKKTKCTWCNKPTNRRVFTCACDVLFHNQCARTACSQSRTRLPPLTEWLHDRKIHEYISFWDSHFYMSSKMHGFKGMCRNTAETHF